MHAAVGYARHRLDILRRMKVRVFNRLAEVRGEFLDLVDDGRRGFVAESVPALAVGTDWRKFDPNRNGILAGRRRSGVIERRANDRERILFRKAGPFARRSRRCPVCPDRG